ncbi:hypothetical protein [Siccirubricoccus sp. G192]|uniref:hypothetical protein n=1 Tax=Siccirubricoccus sp. G192 TaxID=2849651 RepID=UPI001C2C0A84|nr:hypothetical protein [Siccirubricoccus sp. G192]MBV1796301.1 hypothetical protein [Siccirubricoccus sp. G192]
MSGTQRFEQLLAKVPAESSGMKSALIRVLDTAELCKAWFEDRGMTPSTADLIAATRLVLVQAARDEIEASLDPGIE